MTGVSPVEAEARDGALDPTTCCCSGGTPLAASVHGRRKAMSLPVTMKVLKLVEAQVVHQLQHRLVDEVRVRAVEARWRAVASQSEHRRLEGVGGHADVRRGHDLGEALVAEGRASAERSPVSSVAKGSGGGVPVRVLGQACARHAVLGELDLEDVDWLLRGDQRAVVVEGGDALRGSARRPVRPGSVTLSTKAMIVALGVAVAPGGQRIDLRDGRERQRTKAISRAITAAIPRSGLRL